MAKSLLTTLLLKIAAFSTCALVAGCGNVDRHLEITFKTGEPGDSRDNPLRIPSNPGDTANVTFELASINGFTGEASVLVFPDPLCLEDIDGNEKCIEVNTFPERPYTFVTPNQTKTITIIFDADDGTVTEDDAIYRIRVSAGAVGELVETGVDLYFIVVP